MLYASVLFVGVRNSVPVYALFAATFAGISWVMTSLTLSPSFHSMLPNWSLKDLGMLLRRSGSGECSPPEVGEGSISESSSVSEIESA